MDLFIFTKVEEVHQSYPQTILEESHKSKLWKESRFTSKNWKSKFYNIFAKFENDEGRCRIILCKIVFTESGTKFIGIF